MSDSSRRKANLKDTGIITVDAAQAATVADIAKALGLTNFAIRKRRDRAGWKSINETGIDRFNLDEITLKPGEKSRIVKYLKKKQQAEAIEKTIAALKKNANTFLDLPITVAPQEHQLSTRAQSLATFNRLPHWQRKGAEAKLAIIRAFKAFHAKTGQAITPGMKAFEYEYNLGRIDLGGSVKLEIPQLSHCTLRRWIEDEHERGVMGLVDLYGNRKGMSKIDTFVTGVDADGKPIKPYVNALLAIMTLEPHVEPKKAWEYMLAKCPGGPSVSMKSVARWMDAWKNANPQQWATIVDPDKAKGSFQVAFGDAAEGINGPNQRWEIDATPADLLLIDGRHKIIGIIDVGPRRLKLQVSKTEKAVDGIFIVRRALLDWGVPFEGELRCDNGKTYVADHFQRCMWDLKINIHYCRPFSGEEKPFIERAFHTFSHDLIEHLPGYCGHNVAERKRIEARETFARRLMKNGEVIEMAMTAADLQAFCDRWCASYHDTVHSSLGKSPNQVLSEWPHKIHRITDERALDTLLAPAAGRDGWRTITKKGIQIDTFEYIHPNFGPHIGKQVRCLTTDDVGRIVCQLENEQGVMEHLCIAECPEITGISRAEVTAKAKALQKEVLAEVAALKRKARKEMGGKSSAEVIIACREEKAAASNVAHFPRPSVEYSTPALSASAEAVRDLEGRPVPALSPEVLEARERLKEELDGNRGKVAKFEVESDKQLYKRWKDLKERLSLGEIISEEEYRFYQGFGNSTICKAFAAVEADLGSMTR